MKEVIRKEVLKWLNAGFIYAPLLIEGCLFDQEIRRKLHLHVLMAPLLLEGCLLDYVTLLPPFKDV